MYLCICVFVCLCIYVFMCLCVYIFMCLYIYVFMYFMYLCVYVVMWLCVYVFMCLCGYVVMCLCVYVFMYLQLVRVTLLLITASKVVPSSLHPILPLCHQYHQNKGVLVSYQDDRALDQHSTSIAIPPPLPPHPPPLSIRKVLSKICSLKMPISEEARMRGLMRMRGCEY
jgi:hypothetical protein